MFNYIRLPEKLRLRFSSLARENLALWSFIAQNDLYDEAEDFVNDDTWGKIYARFMQDEENDFDAYSPWEEIVPF